MKDNKVELCYFHSIPAVVIRGIKRKIMSAGLDMGSVLEDPVY